MSEIPSSDESLSRRQWLLMAGGAMLLSSCSFAEKRRLKDEAVRIVNRAQVPRGGADRRVLMQHAERLSKQGLTYRFGGTQPSQGGMDCSGVVFYLLLQLGYKHPPRQSNHQYLWCKEEGFFRKWSGGKVPRRMKPGDLIFWENTYDTGRRYPANISHVMIYVGKDRQGRHQQFGGRGSRTRGINGAGIDFHYFDPDRGPGRLIGWGRIPGMK